MRNIQEVICNMCGAAMDCTSTDEWKCAECDNEAWIDSNGYLCYACEKSFNDIPEGCSACGGPYPYCAESCPIFDD